MAVGKKITWGKGKQYHLPCNIEAVGKNIKQEKGEWDGHFGKETFFLNGGWGRISSYTPLILHLGEEGEEDGDLPEADGTHGGRRLQEPRPATLGGNKP